MAALSATAKPVPISRETMLRYLAFCGIARYMRSLALNPKTSDLESTVTGALSLGNIRTPLPLRGSWGVDQPGKLAIWLNTAAWHEEEGYRRLICAIGRRSGWPLGHGLQSLAQIWRRRYDRRPCPIRMPELQSWIAGYVSTSFWRLASVARLMRGQRQSLPRASGVRRRPARGDPRVENCWCQLGELTSARAADHSFGPTVTLELISGRGLQATAGCLYPDPDAKAVSRSFLPSRLSCATKAPGLIACCIRASRLTCARSQSTTCC